jgi:AcrR family transcriptional regulator
VIDREAIARAAHEIGLSGLTLRAVADKLGVSVGGLYHHIESRDDLLRLAAEYTVARTKVPEDRGQHWAVWLMEWAVYNRDTFANQPGLLTQYMEGVLGADAIADNADTILRVLRRQGFEILEAQRVYNLIATFAIGSAINSLRQRQAEREGHSTIKEYKRVFAKRGRDELPDLRMLIAAAKSSAPITFENQVMSLLETIARQRGDRWPSIKRRLAATFAE